MAKKRKGNPVNGWVILDKPVDMGSTTADLVKALNKQAGFFRKILGTKIRLRLTPEIRFFADGAQAEADKIDALLASEKVQRDLVERTEEDDAGN